MKFTLNKVSINQPCIRVNIDKAVVRVKLPKFKGGIKPPFSIPKVQIETILKGLEEAFKNRQTNKN